MSELSEAEKNELVCYYIDNAYDKLIDIFNADLDKYSSLTTSIGYLHMAKSLKPESEEYLIKIYSLNSIVFAYLDEWGKSLEYQKLVLDLDADNFYAKLAKTIYQVSCHYNQIFPQAQETIESFLRKYKHQDDSTLNFWEYSKMLDDEFLIISMIGMLETQNHPYRPLVELALSAPFDKTTVELSDFDEPPPSSLVDELVEALTSRTTKVQAYLHYFLALSE